MGRHYQQLLLLPEANRGKMKEKKHHTWPNLRLVKPNSNPNLWQKEEDAFRSFSVAYRWDEGNDLTFITPLLFFSTVEAPMTGGWLVNKFSTGLGETDFSGENEIFTKLFGHQILHATSASRWLDTYVALGYEIYDIDIGPETAHDTFFTSEAGLKIRFNITKTRMKFLRHFGTDYWGLRLGWKNTGFHPFEFSGFVLEIGAGMF